jgi:hypothetical protein
MLALGLLMAAFPAGAQTEAPREGWRFELTPYAWLAGMSGNIGSGPKEAHTSASFTDIARNLDSALMLHFEARKGRWGFFVDPFYIDLGESVRTPYGFKLAITTKQLMVGFMASYRAYEKDGKALDILFGGKYNGLKTDLEPSGVPYPARHFKKDWVDPMVGLRARFDLGKYWVFGIRGDIGGFSVGSNLAWDAIARFDVRASKSVSFNFGYGVVSTDYESGSGENRFLYDVRMDGPFVGVAFVF